MTINSDGEGYTTLPAIVWDDNKAEPTLPLVRAQVMSVAAFELGFALLGLFHFGAQVSVPEACRNHPIASKLLEQYQAAFEKCMGKPSSILVPNGQHLV